jgi:hypothetical protein
MPGGTTSSGGVKASGATDAAHGCLVAAWSHAYHGARAWRRLAVAGLLGRRRQLAPGKRGPWGPGSGPGYRP